MSALHQHGQKVDVHYELDGEDNVKRGRLYGSYDGTGPVSISVSQDRRVTFPENRVLFVTDVRSQEAF